MCYLLKPLMFPFLYKIYVNKTNYVKKINKKMLKILTTAVGEKIGMHAVSGKKE